jgi:transposase
VSLAVTTYRRMSADLEALQAQTRRAFVNALVELIEVQGLSGLEASRRLGVSQAHVSRVTSALRLAGLMRCDRPAENAPTPAAEREVPAVPSGS